MFTEIKECLLLKTVYLYKRIRKNVDTNYNINLELNNNCALTYSKCINLSNKACIQPEN